MKLYAFTPNGHGQLSFFVMAGSLERAKCCVDKFIREHMDKDDGMGVNSYSTKGWGTEDYYVDIVGEDVVVINEND